MDFLSSSNSLKRKMIENKPKINTNLLSNYIIKNQAMLSDGLRNMDFQDQDWVSQTSIKFKSQLTFKIT